MSREIKSLTELIGLKQSDFVKMVFDQEGNQVFLPLTEGEALELGRQADMMLNEHVLNSMKHNIYEDMEE